MEGVTERFNISISKRKGGTVFNTDYGPRHNFTTEEARAGIAADAATFGERYRVLSIAQELMETDEELVRDWYDLYAAIIDERSYTEFGRRMEELEDQMLERWGDLH